MGMMTKHFAHHADQPQGAIVADAVIHPIGIFTRRENAFISENCQMLRDIALRRAHMVNDVLHADFTLAEGAQDFQPERVRHGFQRPRGAINIVIVGEEVSIRTIVLWSI